MPNDDAEDMFLSQALGEEKKRCVRFAKPSSDEDIENIRQEADDKNTLKSTKFRYFDGVEETSFNDNP